MQQLASSTEKNETSWPGRSAKAAVTDRIPWWVFHILIVFSGFMFAISSVYAKIAVQQGAGSPAVTFGRFFIGWLIVLGYLLIKRPVLAPKNIPALISRGVFNLSAVFLFYSAVKYTTITNANLLNMTYPVFVALLGPLMLGEKNGLKDWLILMLAGVGVVLVIDPDISQPNFGDILGLGCGMLAALAIISLRSARKQNQTITVLTYLLTTGVLISWPAVLQEDFSAYTGYLWIALIICAVTGIAGQLTITLAFRKVTAFTGSLLGTIRVVLAAIMGMMWFNEVLTWNVVVGGVILMISIGALSKRSKPGPVDKNTALE